MEWPEDCCHMTGLGHRLRTRLVNGIEHFSFVLTLLKGGREKKERDIYLTPLAVG